MRRCWRQHRREDCGLARVHNRLKHFFPSGQHREHQIVYVKADLLKVAGRVAIGLNSRDDKMGKRVKRCFRIGLTDRIGIAF